MRILTTILLLMSACFMASATEQNTTILVKQFTETQRDQLPDKTIQIKLQRFTLNEQPLSTAINDLLAEVVENDLNQYVYTLFITKETDDSIAVVIHHLDNLNQPTLTKEAKGVIMKGNSCFIIMGNDFGAFTSKVKGKQTLIQEYEMVEEIIPHSPTSIKAIWTGDKLNVRHYEMNGTEQACDTCQQCCCHK